MCVLNLSCLETLASRKQEQTKKKIAPNTEKPSINLKQKIFKPLVCKRWLLYFYLNWLNKRI